MILISHRGNINGKEISNENNPNYIKNALNEGYNVEVDVWIKNNKIYLGHDEPQYKTDLFFLGDKRLWCHAKNYEALSYMLKFDVRCFWHQEDTFTITSDKQIWQYPDNKIYSDAIFLFPEKYDIELSELKRAKGICSDYIKNYKKL